MPFLSQQTLVLYGFLTDVPAAAAVLWILRKALRRTELSRIAQRRTWLSVAALVAAWYIGFTILARNGFFQASREVKVPHIPFGVFVPLMLGWAAALWVRPIRRAVEVVPQSWLIGVQVYRVIGVIFVLLVFSGQLPAEFGLPAGLGDIAVGLLAVSVAFLAARKSRYARPAAYLWNALGIFDFVTAIATGFLSSPSRIQRLAFSHPNVIGSAYPLVMIPVFLVPLSWILHLVGLWKLRQKETAKMAVNPDDTGVLPSGEPSSVFSSLVGASKRAHE